MQSQSELIQQAIDRFINDGIAPPFYRHLLDYGQRPSPLKTPKDTLYIHERPGQIIVLSRGAVSVQWANWELKKYQKNLRQGLIKELFYPRRTDTNSAKDKQLLKNGDWLEEQRFMVTTKRELVVLRQRKKKKLD